MPMPMNFPHSGQYPRVMGPPSEFSVMMGGGVMFWGVREMSGSALWYRTAMMTMSITMTAMGRT